MHAPALQLSRAIEEAFRFRTDEEIQAGFGRILNAMADEAELLHQVATSRVSVELVHHSRTLIKQLRALLWFAKPALAPEMLAQATRQLRAAALLMAAHRDAAVIEATLKQLAQDEKDKRDRAALTVMLRKLASPNMHDGSSKKPVLEALKIVSSTIEVVKKSVSEAGHWPAPQKRVDKAQRHVRAARKSALRTEGDVEFHTWRKKAKRLMYELSLTKIQPRAKPAKFKIADKLQKTLGDRHDLVIVEEQVRKLAEPVLADAVRFQRVLALIGRRKRRLVRKAKKLPV